MKTTVVKGVLTSYELMLAILFRWRVRSCGSDAVTDPVTGWIIPPLPHNIAQLLTSPHLKSFYLLSLLLSLFCCRCTWHCQCCYTNPFWFFLFPPLEMWSTVGVYACIIVSIGNEGHKSSSASGVTIITLEVAECRLIFLGGGWPDELGSLVIRG
jgi:hypothetical protein